MTDITEPSPQAKREEFWNTLTHSIGFLFGLVGFLFIVYKSILVGDGQMIVASVIFGLTLMMMYFSSSYYHAMKHTRHAVLLKKLDHISIYFLISGTYTFFLLGAVRGPLGWSLFFLLWGLTLLGTVFKVFYGHRKDKWIEILSLSVYIGMGWVAMIVAEPLSKSLPPVSWRMLILGGIAYTGGVYFYARREPYFHIFWHICVLLGSMFHYFSCYMILVHSTPM